jgi:hypothetical protein
MENIPTTYKAGTTKKCPMCAEEIPLKAIICEFCGARFKVTRAGYCQSCHTVREADANDCCIRCGIALSDIQIKSEHLNQDPASLPRSISHNPPPRETVQAQKKSPGRVLLWLGMSLILVGAFFVAFQYGRPALIGLLATETPRPTLTPRPTFTATATPTLKPTRTPIPAPVEVTFDDVSSYPEGHPVIMSGQLVMFKSTYCDTQCGLLLAENSNSSHKITIFVDVAEPDIEPVPNQMKHLPDPYGQWDIRVRLNDGTYAFIGQRITVTGQICNTTDGDVCISDIYKIELAQ